jgi:hypothetical protein
MACMVVRGPDGKGMILCGVRRRRQMLCSVCRKVPHVVLCDGRRANGTRETCSAPLCNGCAKHVEKNRDYCPRHAWQAKDQLALGGV